MRKYLLPENGNFYKANLHSHTTNSDGLLTASEMKDVYKAKGYSVLAFSDHEINIDHSHLNDSEFLAITAYELSVNEIKPDFKTTKTYHLNLYAKKANNNKLVCFNTPMFKYFSNVDINTLDIIGGEFKREYSVKSVNKIISEANKNGFLVSYNHPSWSLQTSDDYMGLKGLFAMEIYNHGCNTIGNELNSHVYDEMLRAGNRLHCLANDDNHSGFGYDIDKFGGFNMIKCQSLDYESIINALEMGNFYASTGPEITDLYFENNKFYIKCAPAREILMSSASRYGVKIIDDACNLTKAEFTLSDRLDSYVRFTVVDKNGKSAFTRAYFFDELR